MMLEWWTSDKFTGGTRVVGGCVTKSPPNSEKDDMPIQECIFSISYKALLQESLITLKNPSLHLKRWDLPIGQNFSPNPRRYDGKESVVGFMEISNMLVVRCDFCTLLVSKKARRQTIR